MTHPTFSSVSVIVTIRASLNPTPKALTGPRVLE
jgi:hypothetical protein